MPARYPADAAPSPTRDDTLRHYAAAAQEPILDCVLHGDGPACRWTARANPGDALVVGGPRGAFVAADGYDADVLIGDETALPAIGRWREELPAGAQVDALIEIPASPTDRRCRRARRSGWSAMACMY